MIAAGNGDVETARTLVKRECDVNKDTSHGMTALVAATQRGGRKGTEIATILKQKGALEKKELREAKVRWAEEEEERRNRPQTPGDRPVSREQRKKDESKIRIL